MSSIPDFGEIYRRVFAQRQAPKRGPGQRATLRPAMAVDAELLKILACPLCKEEVRSVPLATELRASIRDKYRDKFRGEEPVVEEGLRCVKCGRIYPIVSDIPVMLVDEAIEP